MGCVWSQKLDPRTTLLFVNTYNLCVYVCIVGLLIYSAAKLQVCFNRLTLDNFIHHKSGSNEYKDKHNTIKNTIKYVYQQKHNGQLQICIKYSIPDAVPPIHAVSSHVATDKDPSKFRSIFSDNLQPIATREKKARGTLLVAIGCSSKRAPLPVSYYNEISGCHVGSCRSEEEGLCRPSTAPVWSTMYQNVSTN